MWVPHSDIVSKNLSMVKGDQVTVVNGVWDTTHLLPRFVQKNYGIDSTHSIVNKTSTSDIDT